ncbi:thiamine diphosphokinase [Gracilimonas sp. BCB1]|uniref:thiamine diphosphokinase n=1 Tax=Gracilimonas sp. BCB1 TaxID=3152362 RepID=UPI0032D9A19E
MHAVIVSNGFPPSKELLEEELKSADLIIGADGGGNTLLSHGHDLHVVIGDMDSFKKPKDPDFEIIKDTDQETNDLEKALSLAVYRDAETCTVLGAFGRRMDHSLKNLSVLKRFDSAFNHLLFKDERLSARLISSAYSGNLPIGSIISLFPLSGKVTGITTKGLKYPLNNEILENGERDGTSNENVEEEFSIEIDSGDLVVFLEN